MSEPLPGREGRKTAVKSIGCRVTFNSIDSGGKEEKNGGSKEIGGVKHRQGEGK
jgi:hypothetical protein